MPLGHGATRSPTAAGVAGIGLEPKRRTMVQLRVGRRGLRDLPFVTDLHESFYFKGEGDNSVWVCPLDETPVDPCDAAPEEIDVAIAIDRFEKAVDWPVEAVERKWAGLRTFAPDRRHEVRLRSDQAGLLLVRRAGRHGNPDRAGRVLAVRRADPRRGIAGRARRNRPGGFRSAIAVGLAPRFGLGAGERIGAVVLGMAAWPLTQCHSIRCGSAASSSACHSSAFLTGFLSAVLQPLRRQPWIHLVMPSRT